MADSLPPPSRPPKLVSFVCNNMRGMLWMHAPLSCAAEQAASTRPPCLAFFRSFASGPAAWWTATPKLLETCLCQNILIEDSANIPQKRRQQFLDCIAHFACEVIVAFWRTSTDSPSSTSYRWPTWVPTSSSVRGREL